MLPEGSYGKVTVGTNDLSTRKHECEIRRRRDARSWKHKSNETNRNSAADVSRGVPIRHSFCGAE